MPVLEKNNTPDLSKLFLEDGERARRLALIDGDWLLDGSRLPLSPAQHAALPALAAEAGLPDAIARLFAAAIVNPSERRPALHMALRAADPDAWPGAGKGLAADRDRFLTVADDLHRGRTGLTDLIHVGIGGSDLGPRLVADALDDGSAAVRVHWLSTLDGRRLDRLLAGLDPARTGVVVASKSFSTEETLLQAAALRDWLGARFADQCWAATAMPERATAFGIGASQVLPFPDWTGGRFSLWSSVGVSAAALIGREAFDRLLAGAAEADRVFSSAARDRGLAVQLALMIHVLRRHLDAPTLGVIAYDPRLALLGDYLQQLVMESLGKGVDLVDRNLALATSPLLFGGRGTDLQHSIFQALHQGTDTHPLLLVGSLDAGHARPDWHRVQLAHLLAQATALARGRDDSQPCRCLPGNRPVALLLARRLDPVTLGYLLASFEHAVFALSVLWNINPFDQWGVEEGKRLAGRYRRQLEALDGLDFDHWLELGQRGMTEG